MKIIFVAPSLGVQTIDLAPGEQRYKKHFGNGAIPIALGAAEVQSLGASARRISRKLENEVRQHPPLLAAARGATAVLRSIWRPS